LYSFPEEIASLNTGAISVINSEKISLLIHIFCHFHLTCYFCNFWMGLIEGILQLPAAFLIAEASFPTRYLSKAYFTFSFSNYASIVSRLLLSLPSSLIPLCIMHLIFGRHFSFFIFILVFIRNHT